MKLYQCSARGVWIIGVLILAFSSVLAQTDVSQSASLEGTVIDWETGQGVAGAIVRITTENNEPISQQQVSTDGAFRFRLDPQQRYVVQTQAKGYTPVQEKLAFTSQYTKRLFGKRIRLKRVEAAISESSGSIAILFDQRSARLSTAAIRALEPLIQQLTTSTRIVELVGHTDNIGRTDLNQLLAEDRAEAVKLFLVKNGIAASRITSRSERAVTTVNQSEETRRQNRRVEVLIR